MIWVSKKVGIAVLLLSLAAPAYAQVCKEPTGSSASNKANMTCDMSYRDTLVTCDAALDPSDTKCKASTPDPKCIVGTRASCPNRPMPMITMPNKSYINDYTSYLWQYPRSHVTTEDPDASSKPYSGAYALGTPGDTSRTFQIAGNTAPGTKRLAACTTQIRTPTNPQNDKDWAKLIRLQLDNCTNQYLLNAARYPVQKEGTKVLSMDDPAQPSKVINLTGECQPLKTFTETENEYAADHYIEIAWKKTLQDPKYRTADSQGAVAVKCIPCVAGLQACDKEPHLPCGTILDNPLQPPPAREVRLSTISTVKAENINDPTHPFSPRWDYLLNDRDYSNLSDAQLLVIAPTTAYLYKQLQKIYLKAPSSSENGELNDVFCAGVRSAQNETDAKKKADATVRVDILSFRAKEFNKAVGWRTTYNAACFAQPSSWVAPWQYENTTGIVWAQLPFFLLGSWCWVFDGIYFAGPVPIGIYAHNKSCWKCFGLPGTNNSSEKIDDEDYHPPCTTTYVGKDLYMKGVLPGGLNAFKLQANCRTSFPKVCQDMRKPYTNLNVLKMRYHNPDDQDDSQGNNIVLKKGTGEGMTFKEYFGNHMPYPRIWDMGGVSLQNTPSTDLKRQPPLDTVGQYTAIVGIGREAAPGDEGDDANGNKKPKDERCLIGGWSARTTSELKIDETGKPKSDGLGVGGTSGTPTAKTRGPVGNVVTFGGVSLLTPDPITSWTEMKLYQARSTRQLGISCLARYEKAFKPGSAENMMMLVSGGIWQQLIINKCDRDVHGTTKNCKAIKYAECLQDADCLKTGVGSSGASGSSTTLYLKDINIQAVTQPWRGYLGAEKDADQFPNWPSDGRVVTQANLDNALQGDIILLPKGPKDATGTEQGLAKLAFVIETRLPNKTDCATKKDCYVRVLEPDDGKWPDSCGSTDTWGEMKTRYYFKPGMLPLLAKQEFGRIHSTGDCQETKISHCEQSAWDSLKLYSIRQDNTRKACDKLKAIDCK